MSYLKIIIDKTKVSGSNSNFPVLFTQDATGIPSVFWTGVTDPGGLDIRFYDTDGITELKREIYSFDATLHTIEAWIQVPTLSDAINKVIYCYYGGSPIANSLAVWTDIDARVIMHFGVSDGPYVEKNSAGGVGGDINGSPTLITGKVGNAYRFVNDADNVNVGITPSVHDGIFTVLAWAYATTAPSDYGIVACSNGREALFFGITPSNPYGIYPDIGWGNARYNSGWLGIATGDTFTSQQGSWKRVVTTYDGTTMKVYVNGSLRISGLISSMVSEPGVDIGNNHSGGGGDGYSFKGYIDEVDCYTDVKSDDWLLTDFNNQNDPASFLSVSLAELDPPSNIAATQVDYTHLDVNVSWDASSGADQYVLQRDSDSGFGSPVTVFTGPGLSFIDTAPSIGTWYYRVKAQIISPFLESSWSSTATVSLVLLVCDFSGIPTSGIVPFDVQFTDTSTGSPTGWDWDFGDSSPHGTIEDPLHTYVTPGTYTVHLTVTRGSSSSDETKTGYIHAVVLNPPSPLIASQVDYTHLYVNIGWGASTGADQYVLQRDSDSGFGSPITVFTGPGLSFIDTAPSIGTWYYRAKAQVISPPSESSWSSTATVAPVLLACDFWGTPLSGSVPLGVQFTDLSTGGPTGWDWDFGDGSLHGATKDLLHTYTTVGTFTVHLTVTRGSSSSDKTETNYITVVASPPAADFSASPTDDEYPLEVTFTDLSTSSSTITSWLWNLGDGTITTAQNPTHTYNTPGSYTISLTVTNSYSLSDTETKVDYIRVRGINLIVDFVGVPRDGESPLVVDFTNLTAIPAGHSLLSWLWDFGDGQTSADENPTHVYLSGGLFTVTLKAFVQL